MAPRAGPRRFHSCNEADPDLGSPFDVLLHALLSLRELPPRQREAWRTMLDLYVFGRYGDPLAHLPSVAHGTLGEHDAHTRRQVRMILLGSLARQAGLQPPDVDDGDARPAPGGLEHSRNRMRLEDCYRTEDFRRLARRRLPAPIFHYIDGGADDESTLRRNTSAFDDVDLVPNVLAGIDSVDLSVNVLGARLKMPLFFSPTALQRLFHHEGERAIARAADRFGTMFCVSTIGTRSIEELGAMTAAPKLFQIYVHKDPGLTTNLIERCRTAGFNALALTVDTIVAGNRERDFHTGMTTPPKLNLRGLLSFATHPGWSLNYLFRERFDLPNLSAYLGKGGNAQTSVVDYMNTQLLRSISWDDAAAMIEEWGGPFAIKGVMSVADARRCVEIGASAIMISNHGGRQLDGARSPFDQLSAILDAVGGEIEVILDGGVRRGTHVLKAIAMGATACSGGRMYLYALGAAGPAGVERAIGLLRDEMERDMLLMGCRTLRELNRDCLACR